MSEQQFGSDERDKIQDKVWEIGQLNVAFKQTFYQLFEILKNKENADKMTTSGGPQVAYKLLIIGEHMHWEYMLENRQQEKMEWAFSQFVANLAIYSLGFDKFGKGEILKIAESWPIGMADQEDTIGGSTV
jgi:hypothetical protein